MMGREKKEAERQLSVAHETMQHLETQLQEKEGALAAANNVSCCAVLVWLLACWAAGLLCIAGLLLRPAARRRVPTGRAPTDHHQQDRAMFQHPHAHAVLLTQTQPVACWLAAGAC
jgi:hypothetical protein